MDLNYPPEADEFRSEVRAWLEDQLPEGWNTAGFTQSVEERAKFNEDWTRRLFDGGWICATWPPEYTAGGACPRSRPWS